MSPEKLAELMATTQSEYSIAIRKLRPLERAKMLAEAKTRIIITAHRVDLIKNKSLKEHLKACFEDPKFKPTVDFINSCIYIEHQELMEDYNAYEQEAKQAVKEFEMLSDQAISYASDRKFKQAELINKI